MTPTRTDRSAGHEHGRRCYWDHLECEWVCGPVPAAAPPPERPDESREPVTDHAAGASAR